MIFIGIDPGITGGIAALDGAAHVLLAEQMPTTAAPTGTKRWVDPGGIARLLRGIIDTEECRAAIERVGARPGEGVTSSFSFGQSFGLAYGVVGSMGIGIDLPMPQKWKAHHSFPKAKDAGADFSAKQFSIGIVARRWPGVHLRKSDHGIADALLLADWLRAQYRSHTHA